MPEGINSVADLRVIVDANADKFHSGVQGVMSALGELDKNGNKPLTELDKIMGFVGDTALGVRGKVMMLTAGVEAGAAMYQRFAREGRQAAEMLGVTTEYDRLTSVLEGLGMTIMDGVVGAFFAMQSTGMSAASSMLGFASNTEKASASSESFAANLLNKVRASLEEVDNRLRIYNSSQAQSSVEIDNITHLLDRRVDKINEEIAALKEATRAAEENGGVYAYWAAFSNANLIKMYEAERDSLAERRRAMQEASEDLPMRQWNEATQVHTSLLGAENLQLDRRIATLGRTAGAVAEYNAFQKAMDEAARQRLDLSAEQIEWHRREAAEIGRKAQAIEDFAKAKAEEERSKQLAAQRERSESQIFANADREISNLRIRAESIGLNARETAELAMQERLLQQLRASGNDVSDAEMVKIRALASEYGKLTETVSAQQAGLRRLGEIGQTVSGTLASAFAQWTRGAELDVKSMVASMLNDLAQLTFRRGVLEPLFGGGMGGSGSDGGLLGSLLGSVFGGFREGGGDVEAGKAYVVGEKRAELFIPGQSGTIAPSVGGRAGGEIHVYVHGTEDFEARVESTAEGVVARQAPAIVQAAVASSSKVGSRTLPGQLQNHQRRGTQ